MTDRDQPDSDQSPFNEQPLAPAQFSGCGKPVLLGCGVLIVLFGLGFVVLLLNAKSLFRWSFERSEAVIVEKLAPEVTQAQRERLGLAFRAATEAVISGGADISSLLAMQEALNRALSDSELSGEEVEELTSILEQVGGRQGEPPGQSAAWSRSRAPVVV